MTDAATKPSTAVGWFVGLSAAFVRQSLSTQAVAEQLMGRAEVCLALAELPEEMAARARCWPDLFRAEA